MRIPIAAIALLALVQGCNGNNDTDAGDATGNDATHDVAVDSPRDIAVDVQADAVTDTGSETGVDVVTDTGVDVAQDADAGSDAGDAGSDAGDVSSDADTGSSAVCATWGDPPPVTPAPPPGAVLLHAGASGTQNYRCTATTTGGTTTYAWAFTGPDAVLSDCTGTTIGHHQPSSGAGSAPQWTSTDGSSVIGTRVSGTTVDATAIPWLILSATSTSGTGVMSHVRYIERANTVGGLAPSTGCDAAHEAMTAAVPYTADYYFFGPDAGACTGWDTAPTVPASIAIPTSAGRFTVALHTAAIGTQNYTCTGTTSGGTTTYAWSFTGPDAVLSDCMGAIVAHHQASAGAGSPPQWTDTDGSSVIGARDAGSTVDTTAVPWLLLHATSTSGTGVLTNVAYIHRVNTVGGVAPSTGCDAAHDGATTRVNYTADYYFYTPDTTGCSTWDTAPTVDPSIAIPASAGTVHVALHTAAAGTQNYSCVADTTVTPATYTWTLTGPDAVLSNCTGATVGHHLPSSGAGSAPQWTNTDGSSVIGARVSGITVDATAVQWLLLSATSTSGTGVLTPVTYVQRVNTVGGIAPATGCDAAHVAATVNVNYTADYFFFAP